jgi:hypothetical protein
MITLVVVRRIRVEHPIGFKERLSNLGSCAGCWRHLSEEFRSETFYKFNAQQARLLPGLPVRERYWALQ